MKTLRAFSLVCGLALVLVLAFAAWDCSASVRTTASMHAQTAAVQTTATTTAGNAAPVAETNTTAKNASAAAPARKHKVSAVRASLETTKTAATMLARNSAPPRALDPEEEEMRGGSSAKRGATFPPRFRRRTPSA